MKTAVITGGTSGIGLAAAKIYLEERRLAQWIHNKAIQKARESLRISDERKEYLRGLRI